MGAVSGQFGTVHVGASELLELTGFTFNRSAPIHDWASNATAGYKDNVAGTKRASGTLKGVYDPDDPVDDHIEEGDAVTLKLYVTAEKFYLVPARIGDLNLEVDLDEGEIIGWDATFSARGAWTNPV